MLGLLNPPNASQCKSVLTTSSTAAKAASLRTGVSPDALIADRVFGQGPDAAALAPAAALGGGH